MFKKIRVWLYLHMPESWFKYLPDVHPRRREADAAWKRDTAPTPKLESITEGMRRDARRERRLSRREELRIPWEQEMRARLMTARVRPDHDTHFGSPISPG